MAAFALTPASGITGVLDFTTSEGRKLYNSATYKLDEDPYDCQPDGLYQFVATYIRERSNTDGMIRLVESYRFQKTPMILARTIFTWSITMDKFRYLRSGILKIHTSHNLYAQLKTHSCSSNA
jgi:hypothetical protein